MGFTVWITFANETFIPKKRPGQGWKPQNNNLEPKAVRFVLLQPSWFLEWCVRVWQGLRSMTRFCSKIGWKWKWSEKCRKNEISLIWCISTTNNVKSCKKINETAETANFTDFPLSSCEYRPKWTKTMQTQTRRVSLQNFIRGIQICHMKADVLAIPKMWWFFIL